MRITYRDQVYVVCTEGDVYAWCVRSEMPPTAARLALPISPERRTGGLLL